MNRLLVRLAFTGIDQRRLQALVTVLAVAGATTALVVALGVGRVADRPYDRTFAATNGAHVVVYGEPGADLSPVETLPGVVASTGPRPVLVSSFRRDEGRFGIRLIGVGPVPPTVSRPLVVAGAWPEEGEVLLERSFARFLGLRPGDTLRVGQLPVEVAGIAVVPTGEAYPLAQPGFGFVRGTTLRRLAGSTQQGVVLGIRLSRPHDADTVAARARGIPGVVVAEPWTEERAAATELARTLTVILSIFATLIFLSTGAVLATLVGARVLANAREIGLLKAVGLTPRQVALVITLEQVVLAVAGTLVGLLAGRLLTPLVSARSAALLEASETPPLEPLVGAIVALGIVGLVGSFAFVPALRAGRRTAAATLQAVVAPGGRRSPIGRLADRVGLPIVVGIGARTAFARRGRAALTTMALALTVVSVVGTLGMEASLDVGSTPPPPPVTDGMPLWDPVDDDAAEGDALRPVVYGLDLTLLFVGLVSLVATIILSMRERMRDVGMLKAVGLTPAQITCAVLAGQALLAVLASLVGIPLGLAVFRLGIGLSGGSDEFAYPPVWSLALLPLALVLSVALLAGPLARGAARLPVADALRYE